MDQRQTVSLADSCFDVLYSDSLLNKIKTLVNSMCLGCRFDEFSQTTHSCIDYDLKCAIENYFDIAIQSISEDDILIRWSNTLETYNISPELQGLLKLKYFCNDWLQTMKTES